ncbi:uncharacterized protein LOC134533317 [Bacillus rossius redtenbacheri]|uniref:uncharacterized protein LOC134533317 n=1 Tax=Bacillus rossius redtenbacheri TaxID=93214 RepID=UPI002FDE7DFF
MAKRELKNRKYENFLRKILENKDVLFGAFSGTLTKDVKKLCWTEIRDYAVAIGLVTNDKDYAYIRDSTWPNLRNRTVAKLDRSIKSGAGGDVHSKLDVTDQLIVEIIGRSSPVLRGLGVPDSFEVNQEIEGHNPVENDIPCANVQICDHDNANHGHHSNELNVNVYQNPSPAASSGKTTNEEICSRPLKKRRVIVRTLENKKCLEELKIRKTKLEVRKLQLEIWETENRLCSAL